MSPTRRGAIILVVMIFVLIGACFFLSFVFMPQAGVAVGLPVIIVPGEPYDPEPSG